MYHDYLITYHRNISAVQWFLRKCNGHTGMFKELVMSEDGLLYSRYMYSMNITNHDKRAKYLKKKLNQKELRFMAYKTFVNILSCRDFDRNVRYILPACVVKK